MSPEALALIALADMPTPATVRSGDLYVITDDRHRYVMLVLGHKRNGRRASDGHSFVFLYNWDEPSLRATPATLRDFDLNSNQAEAWLHWARHRGQSVRYAGSIFDRVPLSSLTPS